MLANLNYRYDDVRNEYAPTLYPGEKASGWSVPEDINADFHRLNSVIESKYSREYLKICAFYNKMFPSLKTSDWSYSSYNVQPFTYMDQERSDTGTGTNYNYLKQIVDQITSRLGTISFTPMLIAEEQSFEYIVYKDSVERILRKFISNDRFNRMSLEAFHDAAVLGYSHVFIDPWTGKLMKANDYEVGFFESQFNRGAVRQMLFRDYAYPVSEVLVYLKDLPDSSELLESLSGMITCDFKMYFDCIKQKCWVTINNKTLPERSYPFDKVLMASFIWDTGFAKQLTTSEFDLLYPIQREINRVAAKIQQMVRMYKGAVPVFNTDVDLAMKSITNGSGECLCIDSTRSVADLMTVINPTPLDPQLSAQITEYKTAMYELAGIQNASFDMENMRSAAAVVALDQTRDSVFQAQLSGLAQFIKDSISLYVRFFAKYPGLSGDQGNIDWEMTERLISQCYINLQPVHLNDPLSSEKDKDDTQQPNYDADYMELAVANISLQVLKGNITYSTVPYYIQPELVLRNIALLLVKFEALSIEVPAPVHMFLMDAYIDQVRKGAAQL